MNGSAYTVAIKRIRAITFNVDAKDYDNKNVHLTVKDTDMAFRILTM